MKKSGIFLNYFYLLGHKLHPSVRGPEQDAIEKRDARDAIEKAMKALQNSSNEEN